MKIKTILLIALLALAFSITACDQEGGAEKVGKKIDKAFNAEQAGKKIDTIFSSVKEKIHEATE
ncbi:hypothetical protein [Desulfotalea psychrophila]|uniref:hypothetical protein n=1 Tax=Desulfotalea psychrophila TaxID=84980 RepID=UPI0002D71660|nr:hypothetical protein [Desulfotalea psychrophila]